MPIRVALAGAHDIVTLGLRSILAPVTDFEVVDDFPAFDTVPDVIVYDAVSLEADDGVELYAMIKEYDGTPVVIVSRDLRPDLAARSIAHGAVAAFSIESDADQIVATVRAIATDRAAPGAPELSPPPALGSEAGLTPREVDVLSGVTRGLSNDDIAHLHSLSVNSVKSYIRSSYRKIGVSTRAQAVGWCLMNGFEPPQG